MSHSTTSRAFRVYKISNSVNSKLYIGITSRSLRIRWRQHLRDAKTSDLPLYRAMRKYGLDAFTIEEIEECPDHPALLKREQYWIQVYDCMLPNGYNSTAGGEGLYGMRHSEETKQKLRNKPITPAFREKMCQVASERAQNPEYIAKLSRANTGKHLTEAAKEKIREARSKQVFPPEIWEKRAQKMRGYQHSEQSRANMSKGQKGRYVSPEHRKHISESLSKLTDEQAAIIKFDAYGLMQKEYAAMFGVAVQTVNGVVKGRNYKHVTREHLPLSLYKQRSLWDMEADS